MKQLFTGAGKELNYLFEEYYCQKTILHNNKKKWVEERKNMQC